MKKTIIIFTYLVSSLIVLCAQSEILIEAEAFNNKGGWKIDQQFTHQMGSSYLLAHGYGHPVANASHSQALAQEGSYNVWVRTMDWVPSHPATPGTFQIEINNILLSDTFGINAGWGWVKASQKMNLSGTNITLTLIDHQGFDGRCDAIYLTTDDNTVPPNELATMKEWRRVLHGLPATPAVVDQYDLVVIGGGMSGTAAAIAAARGGIKVALVQDRPVLGGNTSEEIRVHTLGKKGFKIVSEIDGTDPANGGEEFIQLGQRRQAVVDAENNITQYLSTRAYHSNTTDNKITSIDAKHIETGAEIRIEGKYFVDATGDGWIGYWAGAEYMIGPESEEEFNESLAADNLDNKNYNLKSMMGSSIHFYSEDLDTNYTFPEVPWAMNVAKTHASLEGDWRHEAGIGVNCIDNTEYIRDHLLRAIYGMFYNQKQKEGMEKKDINWAGYVMGKRESRRLVGDYILSENDIRNAKQFIDSVVYEERSIDIHYIDSIKNPGYDWLSEAHFVKIPKYWIPFRSLYSKNINNLMMAGRCASFTHVGLGSPRVMNTGAQMGVAVGYAAVLATKYNTTPRGIYQNHMSELQDSIGIPHNILNDYTYVNIIDDTDEDKVEHSGDWTYSTWGTTKHGSGYYHDGNEKEGEKTYTYHPILEQDGEYNVLMKFTAGDNRSSKTPVSIIDNNGNNTTQMINQQINDGIWINLGSYTFTKDNPPKIIISNEGTDGYVIADAFAFAYNEVLDINNQQQDDISRLHIQNINGKYSVVFELKTRQNITCHIFDIQGREVQAPITTNYKTGINIITLPSNVALHPAVYILQLSSEKKHITQKIIIR